MASTVGNPVGRLSPRPLRRLSLTELMGRIDRFGDREALRELHDHRPVFRRDGEGQLRLVEYVDRLRESPPARKTYGCRTVVLDEAYNLTVDKFSNLPCEPAGAAPQEETLTSRSKHRGPDCRAYYRAVLARVRERMASRPAAGQLEQEAVAANELQGLVLRHFTTSCLESLRRSNPLMMRYAWPVNGGEIRVWRPLGMDGREFRRWLQANVEDPRPQRPLERERVQAIIDQRLGIRRTVPLDDGYDLVAAVPASEPPVPWSVLHDVTVHGLAEAIATEKAASLSQQRPAIRALGKTKLQRMIRSIFERCSQDGYRDETMARTFGVSTPTFSRFAGRRWSDRSDDQGSLTVPDLWRNTAGVLAAHPVFVEAARDAGVWSRVEEVLSPPVGKDEPNDG